MRNKILIVDDSELNRETLAEILEDDFSVMEAENGIKPDDSNGSFLTQTVVRTALLPQIRPFFFLYIPL